MTIILELKDTKCDWLPPAMNITLDTSPFWIYNSNPESEEFWDLVDLWIYRALKHVERGEV